MAEGKTAELQSPDFPPLDIDPNKGIIHDSYAKLAEEGEIIAQTNPAEHATAKAIMSELTLMQLLGLDRTLLEEAGTTFIVKQILELEEAKKKAASAELRAVKAEERATRDPLTKLHNRHWFDDEIEIRTAESDRTGRNLWLLFMDYDRFKAANTQFGHLGADELLKLMATIPVRQEEPIARFAGDEFVQIVDEEINDETMSHVISRYIDTMKTNSKSTIQNLKRIQAVPESDTLQEVSLCIGATQFIQGESKEQFLARANEAMHEAKKVAGKGTGMIAKVVDGQTMYQETQIVAEKITQ